MIKRLLLTTATSAMFVALVPAIPAQAAHVDNFGPYGSYDACKSQERYLSQTLGQVILNPCHKHQPSLTSYWWAGQYG